MKYSGSLTLFFVCFYVISAFAQPPAPKWDEKIIGSTFKTLAKGFTVAADIQKLKEGNIRKLNQMSQDKFNRRYDQVYPVLKELPIELKTAYGVTGQMSKEQAIRNTASLDKKKIMQLIDAVPDRVIAQLFKDYLRQAKENIAGSNLVMQVKKTWQKITVKANTH